MGASSAPRDRAKRGVIGCCPKRDVKLTSAVIVAAGMGSRLNEHTRTSPKCLLEVNGRSIIEHQIDALGCNGIEDVTVVTGYLATRFQLDGLRYVVNENYRDTNILASLMIGMAEVNGPLVATYSDILFTSGVVGALLGCADDIAIVVDTDWRSAYAERDQHPVSEAEKVAFGSTGSLAAIGKHRPRASDASGEFIGMMKCSARGTAVLKTIHDQVRAEYADQPFMAAANFERAYLTDLLQFLVENGIPVRCVPIRGGWMEIDTRQDLDCARARWTSEEITA